MASPIGQTGITQQILHLHGHLHSNQDFLKEYRIAKQFMGLPVYEFELAMMRAAHELYALALKQENQIDQYKAMVQKLATENKLLREAPGSQSGKVTMQLTQHGIKPAYKHQANIKTIRAFEEMGFTDEEIAKNLGVSRATIWRRRKEADEQK